MKNATFTPLLFDGSLDQIDTWLTQFIFVLNQQGELVDVEMGDEVPKFRAWALTWRERLSLEPMPETMGMRRFRVTITTQVDNELHTSDLGHIFLTPLPKSTRLEMATPESRQMRDAIEGFWEKLREHMRADAVLVERVQEVLETLEPEPEEEWWVDQVDSEDVQYIRNWRELKGDTEKLKKKWKLQLRKSVHEKSSKLRGKYKKKLGDKTGLEIMPTKKDIACL